MALKVYHVNFGLSSEGSIAHNTLWAPNTSTKNGQCQSHWRLVKGLTPGEVVLGHSDKFYRAIAVVKGTAYESTKPTWCINDGWSHDGWGVPVEWKEISPFRPTDHMISAVPPFVNKKNDRVYAPLGYLFELPHELSNIFLGVIGFGREAILTFRECANPTTKLAMVKIRCDQTAYRKGVLRLSSECRITKTKDVRLLEAAHLKPHSKCDGREATDPHNGTTLTPTMHTMFDAGYFTFEDNGDILLSPHTPREVFEQNGGVLRNTGPFRPEQLPYLAYHRANVFRT